MRPAHELPSDAAPAGAGEIRSALDEMLAGASSPAEFGAAMIARCREQPDALWEVLALIDQYGRRGQIDHQELGKLKALIARETYGRSMTLTGAVSTPASVPKAAPPADPTINGSRPPAPSPGRTKDPEVPAATVEVPRLDAQVAAPAPVARLAYSRRHDGEVAVAAVEPRRRELRYPEVGSVLLGRYVLKEKLGSGGMGTVFKALDRNRLDLPEAERFVALKILREALASRPEAIDCMKREFLQTQQLSHPSIVNVFDLGLHAGIPCITMELLAGELLSTVLLRLSPRRLERVIVDAILGAIGGALTYAHARGMLHGDLKPGNIMITDQGELRVLDFGAGMLARREPWISEPGQSFNAVTPAYASCERLAGDAPHVRDDIFSFACMAYELLAGVHPFDRKSALQAREARLSPRRIPELSRRQWRALARGLAWERSGRQESLGDLVQDLVLELQPVPLPTPRLLRSRAADLPGRGRKARFVAGAGVVAIGLVIAGLQKDGVLPESQHVREQLSRSAAAAASWMQGTVATVRRSMDRSSARSGANIAPSASTATQPALAALSAPAGADPAAFADQQPMPVVATPVSAPPTVVPAVPGRIEMATDTLSVLESEPVARLIVQRRGPLGRSTTFSWRTLPGTAAERLDYAAFGPITEEFAAGQSTAAILVPIVRDSDPEGAETFVVEISAAGAAQTGALAATTVFIEDDDPAAP